MAPSLQCGPAALLARLSTAGARNDLAASICPGLRSASASPDAGHKRPGSNLIPGIAIRGRPEERENEVSSRPEAVMSLSFFF